MAPTDRFESTEAYYARYRPGYGERPIHYLVDRFELDAYGTELFTQDAVVEVLSGRVP